MKLEGKGGKKTSGEMVPCLCTRGCCKTTAALLQAETNLQEETGVAGGAGGW